MGDEKIFIILGASGSGKTTLVNYLKNNLNIPELVSHTTRGMRPGEINGETYYYDSKEEFDNIDKIEFAEYAGNFYGLSRMEIQEKLKKYGRVVVITEISGACKIREQYPKESVIIYVYTSLENMRERMKNRCDTLKSIDERIENAINCKELLNFVYGDYIIHNENLEDSYKKIENILSKDKSERYTRHFLLSTVPSGIDIYNSYKAVLFDRRHRIAIMRYYVLLDNYVAVLDTLNGVTTVSIQFADKSEAYNSKLPEWIGQEIHETDENKEFLLHTSRIE